MKLTLDQQARLLMRSRHEPRRNLKRFLKDLGGAGSAEELDEQLAAAARSKKAVAESERLDRQRAIMARSIELGVDGRVAEMLADVRVRAEERGLTQDQLAAACGWSQPMISAYLNGTKEPGAKNLAKLAAAVGCVWRLKPDESAG